MFSAEVHFFQHYVDRVNDIYYYPNDIITIDSWDMLNKVVPDKAKIVRFNKQVDTKIPIKVILYIAGINIVGGIETFAFNFCKLYKDYDITIVYQSADIKQLISLSKYAKVVFDQGQHLDCDIIIISNYDMGEVLRRTTKKKAYQVFHAVFSDMVSPDTKFKKHPLVDEIICVSKAAHDGLLKQTGIESKIIYNLLDYDINTDKPLRLLTLCRTAKIKGMGRIMQMAKQLREHHIPFIWFLTGDKDFTTHKTWARWLEEYPEFVVLPYNLYNKYLITGFDYLVQLSDTEAFCYSAYEALQRGVPVIITDYEEAFNTIQDGVNGYIVKKDLSDLDVEKIYHNIPKTITYNDRFNPEDWLNLFKVD